MQAVVSEIMQGLVALGVIAGLVYSLIRGGTVDGLDTALSVVLAFYFGKQAAAAAITSLAQRAEKAATGATTPVTPPAPPAT